MKKPAIISITILSVLGLLGIVNNVAGNKSTTQTAAQISNAERMKKIWEQENLIKEADSLLKAGEFDKAIEKCKLAAKPDLLLHPYDEDRPLRMMARILVFKSEYDTALKIVEDVLKKYPGKQGPDMNWDEQKLELQALIETRNTGNRQPVYERINFLKTWNEKNLPPYQNNAASGIVASVIFRLYEHLGDYDAGIAFADRFLQFYAKFWKVSVATLESPASKNQYFLIKKAFEQDKADGFKGCVEAKPGEVCMGHATKALIASHYFPW